jgi:hypothetical protein
VVNRSLVPAIALGATLMMALAPTVLAECTWGPPPADDPFKARFAFTATVTEASDAVDPARPGEPPFDWHVELTIDRTYRGELPQQLILNGRVEDCSYLIGQRLHEGDRLFIALDRHDLDWDGLYGQMLAWRGVGGRWTFDQDLLNYGSDARFYPKQAREATTTAQIISIIEAFVVPDTATGAATRLGATTLPPVLLLIVFAVATVAALRRMGHRRPRP